ncbi:hypothetical protein Poly21_08580 [Allorhodopirellula heiligendammensis]|uniref:Uncharacterized protein n=1 Tax=Allorhodopirellula heiligendammensis TaxID=2714739 RepID=A0A5C6C2I2_9BACT|nr:hypothetical protein Poly21_08580 [Allorhodopirellula heiligendammensis]
MAATTSSSRSNCHTSALIQYVRRVAESPGRLLLVSNSPDDLGILNDDLDQKVCHPAVFAGNSLNHNPGMVLAAILALAGMLTVTVIALGTQAVLQWRMHLESERDLEFKRDLISLGHMPDQIAKIVRTPERRSVHDIRRKRHSLVSRKKMDRALHGERYCN